MVTFADQTTSQGTLPPAVGGDGSTQPSPGSALPWDGCVDATVNVLAQTLRITGTALAELALAVSVTRSVQQLVQGVPAVLSSLHIRADFHWFVSLNWQVSDRLAPAAPDAYTTTPMIPRYEVRHKGKNMAFLLVIYYQKSGRLPFDVHLTRPKEQITLTA
jgi:hypothetical protein